MRRLIIDDDHSLRAGAFWRSGLFLLALLMAACAPGAPTPTPTDTPVARPTLPPAWTLTPPATPAPPSATPMPSLTPSPTPTLSAAALCENFWAETNLYDGRILAWRGIVLLFVNPPAPDVPAQFVAINRATGGRRVVDIPAGETVIYELPVRRLAGPGRYDWTLRAQSAVYGSLCEQRGWFIAAGRESTRAEENALR